MQLIEDHCVKITGHAVPLIFFKKLQADIYRYLADHSMSTERQKYKERARDHYEEAQYIQ